jgi:D-alanyl-D-alanine carboxypeptidase
VVTADSREALIRIARDALGEAGAPGASVAVMVDGAAVLAEGIGSVDDDRRAPMDADAPFFIYSIAKTLIAAAVLRDAADGALALDAPVRAYLPGAPTEATVRQILDHTGGVADYGGVAEYHAGVRAHPHHPWTRRRYVAHAASRGPVFPPGEGWGYSNVGYLLAVLLLERVSGQRLDAVLRDRFFAPLGLRRTFVATRLRDTAALTPARSAYVAADGVPADVRLRYHPGWVSHGAVVSTAPELARLLDAILAGDLLDADGRAEMLRPVPVGVRHPLFRRPSYGLGVMLDPEGAHGMTIGHGGGGPGYSTGAIHLPDADGRRVTAVALANHDTSEVGLTLAYRLATAAPASTVLSG